MKYNIIFHTTTSCNYNCSYCDVIKDNKNNSKKNLDDVIIFINNNKEFINRFKFFGGEPLIVWSDIKKIIDNSFENIGNNYEIVTNTTLLTDEIGEYFEQYFKIIFFSIDTENEFNYEKVINFTNKFDIKNKLYFNLVINPGEEKKSLEQFRQLYSLGYRGFNILPVYFTKKWSKKNLENLSKLIKECLDLSLKDSSLKLYGFQENMGVNSSLTNKAFFINTDGNIYFSDFVSTNIGSKVKNELVLGTTSKIMLGDFTDYNFFKEEKVISKIEENIYNKLEGQKQLHKIMDYFSEYLNKISE